MVEPAQIEPAQIEPAQTGPAQTEAEPALTVPDLLTVRALDDPEKVAIRQEDSSTLTFAQWDTRSNAVAHALLAGGLRPGDRVGMTFGDHAWIDFAVCWLGAQKAGGVAVPVPARLAPVQAARMLEHCDAAALIGGVAPAGFGGWTAQLAELDGTAATPPDVRIDPGDLAQILYTSGTTGAPKGVAASHANLTHGRQARPRSRPYAHSRCFLHAFPIGTNAGQMMLLDTLVARPFALAAAGFDAERFCRLIAEHDAGTVFLVPAMAIDLLGSGALERHDVSGVVLVSSSAAALPPAIAAGLARAFPAATIVNYYTSTEAVPARTTMIVDPERPASVGWAANGADLMIADEHGEPLPAGQTGEVWLRSAAPQRSYYGDPAATAEVFRPGWIRMGDLGYLDSEGFLYLVDRESDVIKSGGLKVSTLQIEAALYEHPAVAEAAVVGVPHPVMGSVPAAVVVPRSPIDPDELRSFLRERLARAEVPSRIVLTETLPKNDLGKVLKREVVALLDAPHPAIAAAAGSPATLSPTEAALGKVWKRILRTRTVGPGDDFFALGGDSLSATRLAVLAGEEFGVDMPVSLVFDRPRLAGQAAWLDARVRGSAAVRLAEPDAATDPDRPPLSSLQEYFLRWIHETPEPRAVSAVHAAVRISGALELGAVRASVHELARRHPSLRTVFTVDGDRYGARVLPEAWPEVVTLSAPGTTDMEREQSARRLADTELGRPFDITTGPLARVIVIELGPDDHVLVVGVHHLVFDGWSMGVVVRELGLIYAELSAGRTTSPAPVPVECADVLAWARRQWPDTRAYWTKHLDGAPESLTPIGGRHLTHRYTARSLSLDIPAGPADALRTAATHQGATTFMALAACWTAVLSRWTGSNDIVLMSPVPGRTRPEHASVVGCLVQSLLIRVDAAGNPSFEQLLARVRTSVLNALEHQFYPYEEFSRAIPDPAWFRFDTWGEGARVPGLDSQPFPLPRELMFDWPLPEGRPDLSVPELALTEQPDGTFSGALVYNHRAYDAEAVEGLAQSFLDEVEALTDRFARKGI
ncbi:MAG: AMP-binding protein [Catenulispora sp.]|nr:AMP-binding protein [Catenulispora sp.]